MAGIVFTDLDGTLLSHEDYSYEAVLPMLTQLASANVPVILSTSKTFPEVMVWRERVGLSDMPFMVENGSAIYFPASMIKSDVIAGYPINNVHGLCQVVLGTPAVEILKFLGEFDAGLVNLISCSLDQAVALTGLTEQEAADAQQRDFTVPVVVEDDTIGAKLVQAATDQGFWCQQGGRFLHLQGACDKGMALNVITTVLNTLHDCRHVTLALGDSYNDQAMLEAADIAVIVRSPEGHRLKLDGDNVYYTRETAPDGWSEGVGTALAQLIG